MNEKLSRELQRTGREAWVREEIAALKDEDLYELDPANAWKRLKPRTTNKRFLGVLAAVAAWRKIEAQTRDMPRQRIVRDEASRESPGVEGLYPVGEGAGYAGGIVSAAVDALRSVKAVVAKYAPLGG